MNVPANLAPAVNNPVAQPPTPMEMLNTAIARGADLDVLTKLMDLQERWERTQARRAFDDAIASAKAEIKPIAKNRVGHGNRKYADMAAIAEAVDPIITSHGLSYRYRTVQTDRITVTCVLSHRAGHYEETTLSGPADMSGSKNAIQAIGSTLTYLQRYSLTQALGLAVTDDDDGQASSDIANGKSIHHPSDYVGDGTRARDTKPPTPNHHSRYDYARFCEDVDRCKTLHELDEYGFEKTPQIRSAEWRLEAFKYFGDRRYDLYRQEQIADQVVHDTDDIAPRKANTEDFEAREAQEWSISQRAIAARNANS